MKRKDCLPPIRQLSPSPLGIQNTRTGQLEHLKRKIAEGDPVAAYQAVMICHEDGVAPPRWLTERLLDVISNYYLGKKPGKQGGTNSPLTKLSKRIEVEIRRRAVASVRAWQKDRNAYQDMPTQSIEAWFNQDYTHSGCQTVEEALSLAAVGLKGLRVRDGRKPISCSPITLKRTYYPIQATMIPSVPREAALAFGFNDLEAFFGTDKEPPSNLK